MSTESSRLVDEQFEEEFLQCQVCTRKYNQRKRIPKVLPCLHTFCLPCLTKIWKPHRGTLRCPLCNKDTRISQACEELPSDHRVIKLLDWVGQEDAKLRDTCPKHTRERVYFFCDTCRVPVCQQCTVIDHKESNGHDVIDVTQVLTKYDNDFRNIDHNCRETLQQLQTRIDVLKKSTKSLDKSTDQHESDIKEKFTEYRSLLDKLEINLLTRVYQRSKHQRDILQAQHDSVSEQTARLQELYDDFRSSTDSRNVPGLITTAGQLYDQQGLFKQMATADDNRLSEFFSENERAFNSDLEKTDCICPKSQPQLEDIEQQIDRLSALQLSDYGVTAELNKMALKDTHNGVRKSESPDAAAACSPSYHPPQSQQLTYQQEQQEQETVLQQSFLIPGEDVLVHGDPTQQFILQLQQQHVILEQQQQQQQQMSGPQWTQYRN